MNRTRCLAILFLVALLTPAVARAAGTPLRPVAAGKVSRLIRHAPPPRFAFEVNGVQMPRGLVALTFDDGPHRQHTPAILELLALHRAPATFFMLGRQAQLLPGLAAQVAAAGHAVGAHSFDHRKLTTLTDEALFEQVAGSQRLVEEAIGRPVRLFRAPYGARDPRVMRVIDAAHMRHVLWSIDSRDWQDRNPLSTVQRILVPLLRERRGVVLLHDIHPTSVEATRILLEQLEPLRRAGEIRLVTLDELLGFVPAQASLPPREVLSHP